MQAPSTILPGYTISKLDRLQTPATQLAGARIEFEIEISPGVFKNVQGTAEELGAYLATLGGGPAASVKAVPISLADAQARIPASEADKDSFYAVTSSDWNANTPGGALNATVYVRSLSPTTYAPTGWALDANDVLQPVRVDIPAGTYDTKPLRDLQLFQAGDVNAQGEVVLWLGEATTGAGQIKEVLL